jgi:hypothetical protein
MSKRGDRHDIDPTGISPSRAHASTIDLSAKPETSSPTGARNKRRASGTGATNLAMSGPSGGAPASVGADEPSMTSSPMGPPPAKKSRTNTPWTPAEEQRLKTMRDAGNSWADIAKVRCDLSEGWVAQESETETVEQTFPSRTEGSVKKHWYKVCSLLPNVFSQTNRIQDMHYAEFAEDEVRLPAAHRIQLLMLK